MTSRTLANAGLFLIAAFSAPLTYAEGIGGSQSFWPTPSSCVDLFRSGENISVWGTRRLEAARVNMEKVFRSTDGKIAGATVAAPIDPRGEYQFLWTRDNAISFREVADQPDIEEKYIEFCRTNLAQDTVGIPHDENLPTSVKEALAYINGEPKFNADGSKFTKLWGRPQNDGSAYRALRWMEYTARKIAKGDRAGALENYNPDLKKLSLKWDLEYLAHHWASPSFDLWEEELGTHLHTLLTIHNALDEGAKLAALLEPAGSLSSAAIDYRRAAASIRKKILAESWDETRGYLQAVWAHEGGFVAKKERLDIGVIIGLLHATTKPPVFRFSDERVLATMEALERRFAETFRINENYRDPRLRGAVALGRYPEDVFHGGNPWVIATQAGAEYYYRLGAELSALREIVVTPRNLDFYRRLSPELTAAGVLTVGRKIPRESPVFDGVLNAIQEKGDGFLTVIRSVTKEDGKHAEQFGRGFRPGDTGPWVEEYLKLVGGGDGSKVVPGGQWVGAQMLVWNEASFRSTWRARESFIRSRRL